jgi:UDP:flavonoid glycosyltransferase YjiC (YdhE family)
MTKYLAYTSPARGHLYPITPTLLELASRGHDVHVRTLASEIEALQALGLHATSIPQAIEDLPLPDWQASSLEESLISTMETFVSRAAHEIPDLRAAISDVDPDVLIVDTTTLGANTVAELSGLPWAQWLPFFYGPLPFSLPPSMDAIGRIRAMAGADPLVDHDHFWSRAPALLYLTAEPLVPPEPPLPANFRMVGPGLWDPTSNTPAWLDEVAEPIVLVTVSSEYQLDSILIGATLEALAEEDVRVVVSTVVHDPSSFTVPKNAIVQRFVPHRPVIERAACVVCHGGMGITQKALAAGVPLFVAPGMRDQSMVAQRVTEIGAGTMRSLTDLDGRVARDAIREAMTMTEGARRAAEGFALAGGPSSAADTLEGLVSVTV